MTPSRLRPTELRAWRAFLDAQAEVLRRLEADLVKEQRLTLAEYDVLAQLVETPGRRLRMAELSARVRRSRSGLTRLVDRMAAAGLLRREQCPSDRRGSFAVLTVSGHDRLRRATPTHFRGIREYFASRLDRAQLASLAAVLAPLGTDQSTRRAPSLSNR